MQEDFVLADKYTGKTEGTIDDFLKGNVTFWKFSRLLKELYQGASGAQAYPKTDGI